MKKIYKLNNKKLIKILMKKKNNKYKNQINNF